MANDLYNEEIKHAISVIGTFIQDPKQLNNIHEKLENKEFNLVIIGQFKRGKSTFINALLSDNILPTSVLPLTSVVTIISYSNEIKTVVNYIDGKKEEIDINDIYKFVTERSNPKNKLGVKEVFVYYPSNYLKNGIRIIDTPGVGSIFKHNTDVAYKYLPYCDAAVFLMSPDPPISQSELDFLKSARAYIDKFFFVLNKIDIVDENEVEEVLKFNKNLLEKELNKSIRIYPLSAKTAFDSKLKKDLENLNKSKIGEIENEINAFLENDLTNALYVSIINMLLRYLRSEKTSYLLQQKAENISLEQLKQKIDLFKHFIDSIEKQKDDDAFILEQRIKNIHEEIDEGIEKLKIENLNMLISTMQLYFKKKSKEKLNTEAFEKHLTEKLLSEIKNIFSNFRETESAAISRSLEKIYNDLANKINNQIESVIKTASELFNVSLDSYVGIETLSEKGNFYFMLEEQSGILDILSTSFRATLPSFLGKKLVEKHIKKTTIELFDRHCGRVRYDFIRRIQETTLRFRTQLSEKLEITISTIENALNKSIVLKTENENRRKETNKKIDQALKTIEKTILKLKELKEEINANI